MYSGKTKGKYAIKQNIRNLCLDGRIMCPCVQIKCCVSNKFHKSACILQHTPCSLLPPLAFSHADFIYFAFSFSTPCLFSSAQLHRHLYSFSFCWLTLVSLKCHDHVGLVHSPARLGGCLRFPFYVICHTCNSLTHIFCQKCYSTVVKNLGFRDSQTEFECCLFHFLAIIVG